MARVRCAASSWTSERTNPPQECQQSVNSIEGIYAFAGCCDRGGGRLSLALFSGAGEVGGGGVQVHDKEELTAGADSC
jgi:hypothetical protein